MSTDKKESPSIESNDSMPNLKSKLKSARHFFETIKSAVLPALQKEKSEIDRAIQSIKNGSNQISSEIKKPLTSENAIKHAALKVGGESFIQVKERLKHLEKEHESAKKSLENLEKTYSIVAKFTPGHYQKKELASQNHQEMRNAYNAAVVDYNKEIDLLKSDSSKKQILNLAKELLLKDIKKQIKLKELDKKMDSLTKDIAFISSVKNQLERLGLQKIDTKSHSITIGKESLTVQIPSAMTPKQKLTIVDDGKSKIIKR